MNSYTPQYSGTSALVIGVDDYHHVNRLSNACSDAQAVASILESKYDFTKDRITVMLNGQATQKTIMQAFLSYDRLGDNDRVLVYFAGHGHTVPGSRGPVGYLVPVDGRIQDKSSLIRWDNLTRNAELIPAKHILFIMDACYSGLAIQRSASVGERRFISSMLQRRARQVITAGKGDEPVSDGGGPTGDHSVFTGHLLEGLEGKARTEHGVLTASHLMDYVYRKVSFDSRSNQTPHFGHLEGDGDFVFCASEGSVGMASLSKDTLVPTVIERPEVELQWDVPTITPDFLKRSGYNDPDSESFGKNEWSRNLGCLSQKADSAVEVVPAKRWLALVMEPVANQPLALDLQALAKTLPHREVACPPSPTAFTMPDHAITTARSVIVYDSDRCESQGNQKCWRRYLRVDRTGTLEYCDHYQIFQLLQQKESGEGIPGFLYINIIGLLWSFALAAKELFNEAGYALGVRLSLNLVGSRGTMLTQFASAIGTEGKRWSQPFSMNALMGGSVNWMCHDANLQKVFHLTLHSLDQSSARSVMTEAADYLGLAYNHQSSPRCFIYGTEEFPWNEYAPRFC